MEVRDMMLLAVKAADDKRAEDIVALNVAEVSLMADYFIICEGNNEKQVQAIAREIKEKADEAGVQVKRLEGFEQARWILIDIGDVIVHVFHREERNYYNLERLWGDAPREDVLAEI